MRIVVVGSGLAGVTLAGALSGHEVSIVTMESLGYYSRPRLSHGEALVAYAKRFLQLNPDDSIALGFVGTQLTPNDMVEFTRPRLADRPIRIEWHR